MDKTEKHNELKKVIDEALQEFPDIQLPPQFADALVSKLENRLAWREAFAEFGLKIGLVIGALAVLAVVLFFPGKTKDMSLVSYLFANWQVIAGLAIIFFFTFFFDQVFLRFLFRRNRT